MNGAYCPCCGKYDTSPQWNSDYDNGYDASEEEDEDNDDPQGYGSGGSDDGDDDPYEDDHEDDYEDDDMEEDYEENDTDSDDSPHDQITSEEDGRYIFGFEANRERSRSPPPNWSSSDDQSPKRGTCNATYASMRSTGRSPSPATSTERDNEVISLVTSEEETSVYTISSSSEDEEEEDSDD